MKIKHLFVALGLLWATATQAQQQPMAGEIQYKHTMNWAKIWANLPFLSAEERDRELLTWGKEEGYTTKMKLLFDANQSLYTYGEAGEEDGGFSWRKNEFIIYRNFAESRLTELVEMLGKTYIVKDELVQPNWRIMNDLKEVQGQLCMRAVMKDTIKNQSIEAWFAAAMPVPTGPEMLYGLPGIILEANINNGEVIIEADKIILKDVAADLKLPKKMKGREITKATYNQILSDHIKLSIKGQRFPYSNMRY